jgi:hypothetical protein
MATARAVRSRSSVESQRARLAPLVCALLLIACQVARASESPADTAILSPLDGDQIPRKGVDPPCAGGYCLEVHVTGRVSRGHWPFLAVRPEASNPRFWIQNLILQVAADGTFEATAGIGAGENGARQHFDIFVIAHRDPRRFAAWDILSGVPDECVPAERATATSFCVVSPPATIFRTR